MREDWIEVEFGELSLLELGGDWGKDPSIEDDDYIEAYCIRGSEFRNWEANKGKTASMRKIKKDSIEKRNLLLDDILVEISGGGPEQPVGRTVVIEQSVLNHFKDKNLVCTNFLRLIRPSVFVNSTYLNHYLKYFYSTGKIIRYQSGSNNLRNLKFHDYLTIEIPFAPLPIQCAIVSKIEALFSDLDNGIANFKKAQEQLKIYRQAVLKKAFEGELTKEWREKQNNLPTAEELLKQIKQERQNHYNQQVYDWEKAVKEWEKNGDVEDKPQKPQKPTNLESKIRIIEQVSDSMTIHSTWSFVSLAWLSDNKPNSIVDGPFGSSINVNEDYKENGVPVTRMVNIRPHKFISDNLKFIVEDKFKQLRRHNILPGDILIAKVGATIGDCCIYPNNMPEGMLSTTGSCRVRLDLNIFSKKLLEYYIFYQRFKLKSIASQTAQPFLNMVVVKAFPVPFCSLEEQNQVVQEIEFRLSVCDKMEQSLSESILKAEALRQSILKKAFEGRLLSEAEIELCKQAADYEPASELLKKITNEKLRITNEKSKVISKNKSKE